MTMSAPQQSASDDFARISKPADFGVATVKSFEQKRLEEENAHLRSMVEKLSNKLKFKIDGKEEQNVEYPLEDKSLREQLSQHVLGPLI